MPSPKLILDYVYDHEAGHPHNSTASTNAPGYAGLPLPGVQVRISPQGEVLIKSPGRLTGCHKGTAEQFGPNPA